jgi:23S rRNA (cytosine1962-C5)-methyltransferase
MKNIIIKTSPSNYLPHPWIYKKNILHADSGITPGEIVKIISKDNSFLGIGYYNPKSIITIRILSRIETQVNTDFIISRIFEAESKRDKIKTLSNAYRIVSSEADFLPGLIIDKYNGTVVFQITALGMDLLRNQIIEAIQTCMKPKFLYEKSDSSTRQIEGLKKIAGWIGLPGKEEIQINEYNANFIINIMHGHKTGFYLDQRKTRIAAGNLAKGKKVLDICSYIGGFSIHAALNDASEVIACDIKDLWLDYVRKNSEINSVSRIVKCLKGDAFDILNDYIDSKEKFDMIILDPPSFLKNKFNLKHALKGYLDLNRMAMKILNEDGILCTFSCSHNMRNEIFSDMIKEAAKTENKTLSILKRCHQDLDHPIIPGFPESEYLKGYFLKINSK